MRWFFQAARRLRADLRKSSWPLRPISRGISCCPRESAGSATASAGIRWSSRCRSSRWPLHGDRCSRARAAVRAARSAAANPQSRPPAMPEELRWSASAETPYALSHCAPPQRVLAGRSVRCSRCADIVTARSVSITRDAGARSQAASSARNRRRRIALPSRHGVVLPMAAWLIRSRLADAQLAAVPVTQPGSGEPRQASDAQGQPACIGSRSIFACNPPLQEPGIPCYSYYVFD